MFSTFATLPKPNQRRELSNKNIIYCDVRTDSTLLPIQPNVEEVVMLEAVGVRKDSVEWTEDGRKIWECHTLNESLP
jgi:hypothetical protein